MHLEACTCACSLLTLHKEGNATVCFQQVHQQLVLPLQSPLKRFVLAARLLQQRPDASVEPARRI